MLCRSTHMSSGDVKRWNRTACASCLTCPRTRPRCCALTASSALVLVGKLALISWRRGRPSSLCRIPLTRSRTSLHRLAERSARLCSLPIYVGAFCQLKRKDGTTQEVVARAMNVGRSTISSFMSLHVLPSDPTLAKIRAWVTAYIARQSQPADGKEAQAAAAEEPAAADEEPAAADDGGNQPMDVDADNSLSQRPVRRARQQSLSLSMAMALSSGKE